MSASKWIPMGTQSFYWQRGYGAFSVSGSHLAVVTRYIARPKEHHKKLTYREEYNPEYYWD